MSVGPLDPCGYIVAEKQSVYTHQESTHTSPATEFLTRNAWDLEVLQILNFSDFGIFA
jgi:hypothetical protein